MTKNAPPLYKVGKVIIRYRVCGFVLLACLASYANASDHFYSGKIIRISAPPEYCELGGHSRDEMRLAQLRRNAIARNQIQLSAFAACIELKSFREGKQDTFDIFLNTVVDGKNGKPISYSALNQKEVLDKLKSGRSIDVEQHLMLGTTPAKLHSKDLGFLGQDDNAFYNGQILTYTTDKGKWSPVSINAWMHINTFSVVAEMHTSGDGKSDVVNELLKKQRVVAAHIVKANQVRNF